MDYKEAIELLHPETSRNAIWKIADEENAIKKIEEALVMACEAMQELQEYKAIGTLEEVKEAVEKQKAKKPLLGGNTDKLTGDIRICPCCCGVVGMDDMRADFCADCGQKLDWTEVEE